MIVMLTAVWDLPAIDALDDELAFRIRADNVAEATLCAVAPKFSVDVALDTTRFAAESSIPGRVAGGRNARLI